MSVRAVRSALGTGRSCSARMTTKRLAYPQWEPAASGSHSDGPESPLDMFEEPSTARRFSGSFANCTRCSSAQLDAPCWNAQDRGTT